MIANFPSETLQARDIMLSERTQNVLYCMILKKKVLEAETGTLLPEVRERGQKMTAKEHEGTFQ